MKIPLQTVERPLKTFKRPLKIFLRKKIEDIVLFVRLSISYLFYPWSLFSVISDLRFGDSTARNPPWGHLQMPGNLQRYQHKLKKHKNIKNIYINERLAEFTQFPINPFLTASALFTATRGGCTPHSSTCRI